MQTNILDWLEATAARCPDAPAVGDVQQDYTWAQPLRFDLLEKTDIRLIAPQGKDGAVPTVRNADGPYHDGQLVLSVDGFLVSPNVEVTDSEVVSTGFAYSDHNPICMSVTLLAQ